MIHYYCKHCRYKIGSLPIDLMPEVLQTIRAVQLTDQHIQNDDSGAYEVTCVCEQCEQILEKNPHYYVQEKWLQ